MNDILLYYYYKSSKNFYQEGQLVTKDNTQMPGAFMAKKKDGTIYYRSSFTYKNKHISLGSYTTAKDAHEAYKAAHLLVTTPEISLIDYQKNSPLSFEKWVILCNFRDNNLYFSTPIYVRKHYFSYYLDEHTELKFSIDDLFYYASHKIMCRGSHYFVADYGMQVTILTRYGVKSYGVLGKDYNLINGDIHDFRIENIEVLNTYHGVHQVAYRGKEKYRSRIHLRSYYIIGYYDTDLEAAIAYNKAIDILQSNGCKKQFRQNYMEGVSPSTYADIYRKVNISKKIWQYQPN